MQPLGNGFISVVKIFINPIIFLTISLGISGMNDLKKVGRVGGKAIIYFEVVTTLALLIGILVAYIIEPGAGIVKESATASAVEVYSTQAGDFSWIQFLKDNITIQVLIFSIIFGIVLSKVSRAGRVINALAFVSKYVFKALHLVMIFAPVGAFGGMAYTIGKYGIDALFPLAKLMITVYATMALFIFIVLYLIMKN